MNIQALASRSEEVADLLKALSNSHRLLIVCELINGERSVTELEDVVPLSQSALSQHLARLREIKIVTTRREAQTVYYSLADPRVASLIMTLHEVFCTTRKSTSRHR